MPTEFRNEPFTDFALEANRTQFREALAQVQKTLGEDLPLVIGGERIQTKARIESRNPSNPAEIVGRASSATREHADQAVRAAEAAFKTWSRTPAPQRVDVLFRAAKLMRERRHLFSATMVIECGKTWVEADADTAEAIDFFEFYGREMLRYANPAPLVPISGERNRIEYIPLGVGVIIAPWNFPNAILCGMSVAALVTGNTVVMKPASATPLIGYRLFQLLEEAGAPAGTINFLTGSGGEVGDTLVDHPRTRFVSFTGSREVGTRIYERAAKVQPGQIWLKRVVAEMGGKDAIIVMDDADLDVAADGITAAAFGYQGQKCSACSRAIVVRPVYDALLKKVKERTEKLRIGDPRDPANNVGPVIGEGSQRKILSYMDAGRKEGTLITGGGRVPGQAGYFLQPTIFADVAPNARIAQEEIFGPVLAFIPAKDFDDALRIANSTDYGLTGAIYTASRANLDRAAAEFHVGNLYLNRKCTGALVGVHPFGGFNMSGTDSKGGSRDYLLLFLQAKSIAEKV